MRHLTLICCAALTLLALGACQREKPAKIPGEENLKWMPLQKAERPEPIKHERCESATSKSLKLYVDDELVWEKSNEELMASDLVVDHQGTNPQLRGRMLPVRALVPEGITPLSLAIEPCSGSPLVQPLGEGESGVVYYLTTSGRGFFKVLQEDAEGGSGRPQTRNPVPMKNIAIVRILTKPAGAPN